MLLTYCDVCRKQVENPIPMRTFFRVAEINICESCKEDLEAAVKYPVRGKQPFDLGWFDEFSMKLLREGVSKGKISPKR
jgi:hypothetical protein